MLNQAKIMLGLEKFMDFEPSQQPKTSNPANNSIQNSAPKRKVPVVAAKSDGETDDSNDERAPPAPKSVKKMNAIRRQSTQQIQVISCENVIHQLKSEPIFNQQSSPRTIPLSQENFHNNTDSTEASFYNNEEMLLIGKTPPHYDPPSSQSTDTNTESSMSTSQETESYSGEGTPDPDYFPSQETNADSGSTTTDNLTTDTESDSDTENEQENKAPNHSTPESPKQNEEANNNCSPEPYQPDSDCEITAVISGLDARLKRKFVQPIITQFFNIKKEKFDCSTQDQNGTQKLSQIQSLLNCSTSTLLGRPFQ